MNESLNPKQQLQSILSNTEVRGNLTTGDINQIFKIFVNLDQIPKPQGIPQNIISSSTDKFVGRERDLENLNQQLQRNNQVVIAAIEGMGGVGKTELAIQYSLLNLQLETYPGGICWIRAREQDIGLQIVSFARTDLDLNPPDDLELPDRVRWCWKRWREGNTLIVLDDVKDYSDIKPYLPPQPSQFKVLITTRLKLDLPSSIYLAVLSEADALELLSQLVGKEKVKQELETAKELCQRLGYLPLALQLVGRYVKERNISLTEELKRMEKNGLGHPSMKVPANDPSWTLDIKRGVKAAFQLSWEELSEDAQKLGCLLSLFALAPIPWDLVEQIETGLDQEELENARSELKRFHLIQGEENYRLHQLIREFFDIKLEKAEYETQFKQAFVITFVAFTSRIPSSFTVIPQDFTREDIASIKDAIPHLEEVAKNRNAHIKDEDLISPFLGLGRFYQEQSLFEPAEFWYKQSLSVVQNRLGEENSFYPTSLNGLGRFYLFQGKYSEAETLLKQALELRQHYLEEEHPDLVESNHLLGVVYRLQGKLTKAEPLLLRAFESRKRLFGEENLYIADSLGTLGVLYRHQGEFSKAEDLLVKALNLKKRFLGDNHPDVAQCSNSLAVVYRCQKRFDKAETLHLESLALQQQVFGEEYPKAPIIGIMLDLAKLYKDQKKFSEAEEFFKKVLEQQKLIFGEENRYTILTTGELAEIYRFQNKNREAESLFKKAIELFKYLSEKDYRKKIGIMLNLAKLYRHQKSHKKEKSILLQVLKEQQRAYGKNNHYISKTKNRLAQISRYR